MRDMTSQELLQAFDRALAEAAKVAAKRKQELTPIKADVISRSSGVREVSEKFK